MRLPGGRDKASLGKLYRPFRINFGTTSAIVKSVPVEPGHGRYFVQW